MWWDPTTRLTDLLIHAASDPSGEPLARVKLPARVPAGFHGNWVDQAAIDKSVAALQGA
ncbi:carotenoid oxygenase family protein [Brucella anthropi]|uniref:Dioxygenase n=1 Tax=Brucella anthropi TaxID=529 RepID=A0A6L3YZ00_BRUAN|nr:carotenoid oxygenase family protein [Brucella anthropi]